MGIEFFGIGAALAFSAAGSSLGTGIAATAAMGVWKKCYTQGKNPPFMIVAFTGFPASQLFYGMLLMNKLQSLAVKIAGLDTSLAHAAAGYILGAGVVGGIGIGCSAWFQGRAAAGAIDALVEAKGKGTGNYITALGIVETMALLTMVFLMNTTNAWLGLSFQ